ncbi:MAG: S1C family serine protease, partial [Acidimicrobiales bacterium]
SNDTLASTGSSVGESSWPAIADAISPSVVAIQVAGPAGTTVGSGVLYESGSDLAYILTAASLLAGGGALTVVFSDGETDIAHLVGVDSESGIGVVSVQGDQRAFPPLGSVANVKVAEPLMSVGANTTAGPSVVNGEVSSLDASVSSTNGSSMTNLIAVSNAPLPTVNAGAPFVDPLGEVIGIVAPVNPTDSAQQSLSFAIPIDVAEHCALALIGQSKPTHPWLGVADANDVPTSTAQRLGINGGVEVDTVVGGSPASQVGMVSSDVISSLGGQAVTSTGGLVAMLYSGQLPGRVPITYYHQGKQVSATINIVEQPTNLQIG